MGRNVDLKRGSRGRRGRRGSAILLWAALRIELTTTLFGWRSSVAVVVCRRKRRVGTLLVSESGLEEGLVLALGGHC